MKQPCSEYLSDDFLDFATTCNDVVLPVSTYMLNNSEFLILFFEISRTVLTVDSKIEQQYKYCKF